MKDIFAILFSASTGRRVIDSITTMFHEIPHGDALLIAIEFVLCQEIFEEITVVVSYMEELLIIGTQGEDGGG